MDFRSTKSSLAVPAVMKIPLHWVSVWVSEKGTTDPYIRLKMCWDPIHSDQSAAPLNSIWFPRVLGFPGGSAVKKSPAMQEPQEMWVWSLGWEDPLEEDMATHSGILAWRIPWTEEPGRLQSTGLPRVRHNWSSLASMHDDCQSRDSNTPVAETTKGIIKTLLVSTLQSDRYLNEQNAKKSRLPQTLAGNRSTTNSGSWKSQLNWLSL